MSSKVRWAARTLQVTDMDLSEACLKFEKLFEEIHQPEQFIMTDTSQLECVCSGSTCAQDKPVPILYLDKIQAVEAWLETASIRATAGILRWVSKPELIKFQITMADNKRGHRVVNDRYAVRSKFVVE